MYTLVKTSAIALAILAAPFIGVCQMQSSGPATQTVPKALLSVVLKYHISVVAELDESTSILQVPDFSSMKGPQRSMDVIVAQCPGYRWYWQGEVIVFGKASFLHAENNALNAKIPSFTLIGEDLSDFKLFFPSQVAAALRGETGGVAVSGQPLPPQLSPHLKSIEMKDATARDILIQVAKQVGNLYSVMILPSPEQKLPNQLFISWDLAGGPYLSEYKLPPTSPTYDY